MGTTTLFIVIGISALLVLLITVLVRKRSRAKKVSAEKRRKRFDYQPDAKPVPSVPPALSQDLARRAETTVRPKTGNGEGTADITESLRALAVTYSLEQFTLATSDGLVFASSGGENALEDAALYGERFGRDPHADTPGVVLFGMNHRGSDLVGIIRTKKPVSETCEKMIVSDTKDILNKWI